MRKLVRQWNICFLLAFLLAAMLMPAAAEDYSCTASIPVRVHVYAETDEKFTVQLEAEEGVPLPETCSLTFTGNGEGNFGPMTYVRPGDYNYTITQKKGNADYVTYDDSVYTVTVRVTNAPDGGLHAKIWAVRGQETEKSQEVLFSNRYAPPTKPPVRPPQTGDQANVGPVIAVFVAAAVVLVVLVVLVKKRNHKK